MSSKAKSISRDSSFKKVQIFLVDFCDVYFHLSWKLTYKAIDIASSLYQEVFARILLSLLILPRLSIVLKPTFMNAEHKVNKKKKKKKMSSLIIDLFFLF
jgi:hypothetical protein